MSMLLFNKAAVCPGQPGLKWYWRAGCSEGRGEVVQHSTKAPSSRISWWKLVTLQIPWKKVTEKQAAARQLWVWSRLITWRGRHDFYRAQTGILRRQEADVAAKKGCRSLCEHVRRWHALDPNPSSAPWLAAGSLYRVFSHTQNLLLIHFISSNSMWN